MIMTSLNRVKITRKIMIRGKYFTLFSNNGYCPKVAGRILNLFNDQKQ